LIAFRVRAIKKISQRYSKAYQAVRECKIAVKLNPRRITRAHLRSGQLRGYRVKLKYASRALPILLAACLSLLLATSTELIADSLVVPQTAETVALPPAQAQALRVYLGSRAEIRLLPLEIQRMLLAGAPRGFRADCDAVVNSWGAPAHDTAVLSVRVLGWTSPDELWLAYRCGSHLLDLRTYYSERLALFRPSSPAVRFLALDDRSIGSVSNPVLYHLKFAEALKLMHADAASFLIDANSENPCCPGPTGFAEERLVVIAGKPAEMRQVLSITTLRRLRGLEDSARESGSVYRAHLSFRRDARGLVNAILVYFHENLNGKLGRAGLLRYQWNPSREIFEGRMPRTP
jgi:hypothetical protein